MNNLREVRSAPFSARIARRAGPSRIIRVGLCGLAAMACGRAPMAPTNLTGCLKPDERVEFPLAEGGRAILRAAFDGYGCNSLIRRDRAVALRLRAGQAIEPNQTHASLVLGPFLPARAGDEPRFEIACAITTLAQTRAAEPNPHEVGWLVWDYRDNDHFYYLIAKPNGWEIGKRDPGYGGGQQFLATGTSPKFAIGERHVLRIAQSHGEIDAWIDGAHVANYSDRIPYLAGYVGFYCEDSEVEFTDLKITPALTKGP